MSISTVSFCGSKNYYDDKKLYQDGVYCPRLKNNRQDQFQRTTSKSNSGSAKSNKSNTLKGLKKICAGGAGCIAAMIAANALLFSPLSSKPYSVEVPYDNQVDSISEISDIYGVDEDTLLAYNSITEETDLNDIDEIVIPSSYDYLQDEIDLLQEKLFNEELSDAKRTEIEDKISSYQSKQEYQHNIAVSYVDDKFVYFKIKEIDENSPDEIYEKYKFGINVEDFKNIFDIKDGAIKKYNDLNAAYTSKTTDKETDKGTYDYTRNTFSAGDIIKVPKKSIMTNNISFDY